MENLVPCFDQAFLHDLSTLSSFFNFTLIRALSVAVLFHLDLIIINTAWSGPLGTKPLQ